MLTCSYHILNERIISYLFSLMLLALLLFATGAAKSSVSWVTQTSTSDNDYLNMSSDGAVIVFATASTVYGGAGNGNVVIKRLTDANPVAIPGCSFFGSFYPWLTPGGGFVGFYGYPEPNYAAGVYKLVPGAASATTVDLSKTVLIAAVISESGNMGAYLADPDNVGNHTDTGTVYYGTTNLGAATSTIAASADVSKIAYRNSNTIYYYDGSGSSATSVTTSAGGSNYQGPSLSADGSRIAFPCNNSEISILNTSSLTTPLYTVSGEAPLALSSDGTILACKKSSANAIVIYKNGTRVGEITTSGTAAPLEITISTTGNYIGYVATNTRKHVYQWKNELPTLNNISNPAPIEIDNTSIQSINLAGITSGDNTNESQTLTVSAAVTGGTNTNLLKNLAVIYSSADTTGSITYNINDHQAGNAIVTVTVDDSIDIITKTFTVTVNSNKQPTLDAISGPAAIMEDASEQTVNLSGITSGSANEAQSLTVTATSNNTALIPDPQVIYSTPQTTGTLKYTPLANMFGSAVITVKVKDNGGVSFGGVDEITRSFTITVTSFNDSPTLDDIADPVRLIGGNSNEQTVVISGISAGPANESAQMLTITATSSNTAMIPSVIVDYTQGESTATLRFTPATGIGGTSIITVTVTDDGGTANGGQNTVSKTFSQAIDIRLYSVGLSLDKVTPQLEGTTINITAIPNGGMNNTYFFTATNWLTPTVATPLGTGTYQTSPTVSWTPVSGRYTIRAYAKDSILNNVVSKTYTYLIYRNSLLANATASITPSRATPQLLSGVPIALTATLSAGSTGIGLKYKITVTNKLTPTVVANLGSGHDTSGYQDLNTLDWTPAVSGVYILRLGVKDPTNNIIKYKTMYYTIYSDALLPTATVSLTPSRQSPQVLSSIPISITAILSAGSSGVGVKYKFTATNNITADVAPLGTGLDANGYQGSNIVDWTPVVPGAYTLRVAARGPYTNIIKYATLKYTICSDTMLPGATVNLTTNKATPQLLSVDPITLTATMSAGSTGSGLKYKFTVTNIFNPGVEILGSGLDANGYQDSDTVDWTPIASGLYILRVNVKDPSNNYTTLKTIYSYTICSEAMLPDDTVNLTASPVSPQLLSVGSITLTAAMQSGTGDGLRYKFTALNYTTGVTEVLGSGLDANGYSLSKTVSWTPLSVARYSLRVDVLDTSNNFKKYKTSTYYIN